MVLQMRLKNRGIPISLRQGCHFHLDIVQDSRVVVIVVVLGCRCRCGSMDVWITGNSAIVHDVPEGSERCHEIILEPGPYFLLNDFICFMPLVEENILDDI